MVTPAVLKPKRIIRMFEKMSVLKDHQCVSCGFVGMVPFTDRTFQVTCKHVTKEVHGISGEECPQCLEVEFSRGEDGFQRYIEASDGVVFQYRADVFRELRIKLEFSHQRMALLFGLGLDAVKKFETGIVPIEGPLWALVKMYDKRPDFIL
jgi:HTH-type transcriptional regulator/antitoxin MqsA